MINLEQFFEIPFPCNKVSRKALRSFCEDHLSKLAAQNDGNRYDDMINQTLHAYQNHFGALIDPSTCNILQQCRLNSMARIVNSFISEIHLREPLLNNYFGEDSQQYQEFFPFGITEYERCTTENVEKLISRIVNAYKSYNDILGSAPAEKFIQMLQAYQCAKGVNPNAFADEEKNRFGISNSLIELQLTKNLLTLALLNTGNKNAANKYFDQQLLVPTNLFVSTKQNWQNLPPGYSNLNNLGQVS